MSEDLNIAVKKHRTNDYLIMDNRVNLSEENRKTYTKVIEHNNNLSESVEESLIVNNKYSLDNTINLSEHSEDKELFSEEKEDKVIVNKIYVYYDNFMDEDELECTNDYINNIKDVQLNITLNNIKIELEKKNISFQFFKSKIYECSLLNILFSQECNSKEYIDKKLKHMNKQYDNSIFVLLDIPIVFDYFLSKYGNYCINGLNISSFIQACNMNFYYLATLMSKILHLSVNDIKCIFSQSCMRLYPNIAQLMCDLNRNACKEVSNEKNTLEIIMKSLHNYIESVAKNNSNTELIRHKEIKFDELIRIFTNLNPNNIYYYIDKKIINLNGKVINMSLITRNITKSMFCRSKKLELLDDINVFSKEQKEKLKNVPIKDDVCGICYEKKPNIITSCSNNNVISNHQFCNSCMSKLLLKVMPCPMCRSEIKIDNLCCITTDVRKFIQ
jgi:hypothetical protein